MKNNNAEVLQKLHNCLLDILIEIDRICRKHNIPYFLDSGTALGAVRHGGFIPWDDDADVGMIREDYERFIKAAGTELQPRFFLQTRATDPDFHKFSAKIRLNGTYFPESRNEGTSVHQGIFVDIFPFDYADDDENIAKKEIYKARRLYKLWGVRHRHPAKENVFRKMVRTLFLVIPESRIESMCEEHFKKHQKSPTNTVVSYSYKMNSYMILLFKISDMKPTHNIDFEKHSFEIMNNTDTYLKTMFGEYDKLPPEEERIWHFNGEIKFH